MLGIFQGNGDHSEVYQQRRVCSQQQEDADWFVPQDLRFAPFALPVPNTSLSQSRLIIGQISLRKLWFQKKEKEGQGKLCASEFCLPPELPGLRRRLVCGFSFLQGCIFSCKAVLSRGIGSPGRTQESTAVPCP